MKKKSYNEKATLRRRTSKEVVYAKGKPVRWSPETERKRAGMEKNDNATVRDMAVLEKIFGKKLYEDSDGESTMERMNAKKSNGKEMMKPDSLTAKKNPMDMIGDQDEDDYMSEEADDGDNSTEELVKADNRSHTWTYSNRYFFLVVAYTIQKFIRKIGKDILIVSENEVHDFEYDYQKSENIISEGSLVFVYKGIIYALGFSLKYAFVSIKSNYNVSELVKMFDEQIKWNNPLRYKHLYVIGDGDGMSCEFRKIPKVTFDNVILKKEILDDVFDNTIFQIKNLEGTNGIILYGPPGGGKSLCCQVIISEAIKEKINTCFTTTEVDYIEMARMIELFLDPCIVTMEDIDSIALDRETHRGVRIASFLQFLSGLSEMSSRVAFVATTNHIEHLDGAVKNRPMRFNRKIKIWYPQREEIDKLIDLYFPGNIISAELKSLCYVEQFTGAHIKEIRRTCDLNSKKHKKDLTDVFPDAVRIVKENFSVESNYIDKHSL